MPIEKSTLLQKGSKNHSANPHKLNSRISPIRLFYKVWVVKTLNCVHIKSEILRQSALHPAQAIRPSAADEIWIRVNSPNNQVLAIFQSRLAVSCDIPRLSAVSSTLMPPK